MSGDRRDDESGRPRPKVEVLQLAAGALASITAAVLGSRLGVNGTIIGAALGSIVGTVASATYTEFLARTAARVRTVVAAPLEPSAPPPYDPAAVPRRHLVDPAPPPSEAGPAPSDTVRLDQVRPDPVTPDAVQLGAVQPRSPAQPPPTHAAAHWQPPARPPLVTGASASSRRRLPWRGMALAVLGTFLVVVGALTAVELLSGRTLSSLTGGGGDGGTSIGQVLDPAPGVAPTTEAPSPDPTATVTATPTPSDTPTAAPTATVPSTSSPTVSSTTTASGSPTPTGG